MSMCSTFNDIPEELLLKIFLLQPMNSLVLLRNVCKLWDQIISSEYFNKFHLARERASSNTNRYLLLEGARGSEPSLVDSQRHIYHGIPIKNYECYGICDGLLCLSSNKKGKGFSKEHSRIILWNPIFQKDLPPLEIEYSEQTYVCFGHHDDDYKVIKIVVFPHMCKVCIYSLSTNSWKIRIFDGTISLKYNFNYKLGSWSLDYSKGRLVNGIAYFVGYSGRRKPAIISFDLSREIFQELPFDCWYNSNFIMEEYKESLALIGVADFSYRRNKVIVMEVLRKSNNFYPWEMTYLVEGDIDAPLQPVGFINKDELLIRISTPSVTRYSFFLWNVEDRLQRKIITPELCMPMVQSLTDLKFFNSLGVNARISSSVDLGKYIKPISPPTRRPTRQPTIKEAASTSNRYAALADAGDD